MHVLRLLNEPTTAAVAYGLDPPKGVIAVTILAEVPLIYQFFVYLGIFEVSATGGDSALGGDDFDHLLADYLGEQSGVTQNLSAEDMRKVLNMHCRPDNIIHSGYC